MKQNDIPKVQHIKHDAWQYFKVEDVTMYYKVIQDLPNSDLKICVIPVVNGATTDGVYETRLMETLTKFHITYQEVKEVKNEKLKDKLEFIYEATYDYLDGKIFNGNNYLH